MPYHTHATYHCSARRDTPWQARDALQSTVTDEAALADVAPLIMAQVRVVVQKRSFGFSLEGNRSLHVTVHE